MMSDMVDTFEIQKKLKPLGLSLQEIETYLALLNVPDSTVLELSRLVDLPRTTIYRVTEKLVEKKFAEWIIESNSKKIKARKPEDLDFLIVEKKEELDQIQESIKFIKGVTKKTISGIPKTQVRYYKGKEGIKQMVWNTLSAEKEVFGYSEFGRLNIVGQKFYNKYIAEFRRKKLLDRAITNENGLDYIKSIVEKNESKSFHQMDLLNVRFISQDKYYVSGDTSIYNNTYSACYWRGSEVVGFEIDNSELVKMHKSIFEIIWSVATEIL